MSKFNLELFKTSNLNFAYIHSKRRKLGMFILFQKCQFVRPNKVNSPAIRQFPSFSIFGHVTWHKKISRFTFGEKFIFFSPKVSLLSFLERAIANHSLNALSTREAIFLGSENNSYTCKTLVKLTPGFHSLVVFRIP